MTKLISNTEIFSEDSFLLDRKNQLNMICNCAEKCQNVSIRCIESNELVFDPSYLDVMEVFLGKFKLLKYF